MAKAISIAKIGDRKFVRIGNASFEVDEFRIKSTADGETVLEIKIDLYGRSLVIETSTIEEQEKPKSCSTRNDAPSSC